MRRRRFVNLCAHYRVDRLAAIKVAWERDAYGPPLNDFEAQRLKERILDRIEQLSEANEPETCE